MNSTMHWLSTAFDGVVGFIPSLIAGLFILAVGYVVAKALQSLTRAVLGRIHYDRFLAKIGVVDSPDSRVGTNWTAGAVFWLVILAAVMQAARA